LASAAVLKEMWFCPRSVAWRQYLAMIHAVGQIQACDACTLHAHRVCFMRRNPVGRLCGAATCSALTCVRLGPKRQSQM